jgi:6-pyruvoyltetrahydropterin/6-carboxytetrahydropterin synthase
MKENDKTERLDSTGLRIAKLYTNLKGAHRQWRHPGHCSTVHGENWSVKIEFEANYLDDCGFVVDFGKLRDIAKWLDNIFDHTVLIDQDDPQMHVFHAADEQKIIRLVVVPSASAEGLAKYIFHNVQTILDAMPTHKKRPVFVAKVTVYEDSKNEATFEPPPGS